MWWLLSWHSFSTLNLSLICWESGHRAARGILARAAAEGSMDGGGVGSVIVVGVGVGGGVGVVVARREDVELGDDVAGESSVCKEDDGGWLHHAEG